ncbi:MAG: hypothetical protein KJP00_16525, partial [Bacteroidia bacterium]|nr:hypothetical protein [Bacteroidia bacterium]
SLKTTKKIAKVQQEEINDQPEEIIETETESTKISPPVEMKQGDFFGEVITETLAEVLANQGQYQRAIAMYEKLSLIFPEKSAFFAARIENLKNS